MSPTLTGYTFPTIFTLYLKKRRVEIMGPRDNSVPQNSRSFCYLQKKKTLIPKPNSTTLFMVDFFFRSSLYMYLQTMAQLLFYILLGNYRLITSLEDEKQVTFISLIYNNYHVIPCIYEKQYLR